ncbi:MAG: hypothetical protein HQL54_12100 [Magnetococcales bacterium]|nr:hypothetical protein [Magnetococcales bacterium]
MADDLPRAARFHGVMAVGLLPLILSNMLYFVPTLTQSRPATGGVWLLPLLSQLAGGTLVYALMTDLFWINLAAPTAIIAASGVLFWIHRRVANMLGQPNFGVRWYQVALIFFILSQVTILVAVNKPEQWVAFRTLHLHFNLLGFVGMTVFGTLPLLLPTVAGYQDPNTLIHLRTNWKFAILGTVISTFATAWMRPLSWVGMVLWLVPVVRLFKSVIGHRDAFQMQKQVAISLVGVLAGIVVMAISGVWVMLGTMAASDSLPLFFVVFLIPLIIGALSHLLPMWWWPGMLLKPRKVASTILTFGGLFRSILFLFCGLLMSAGVSYAADLALIGVALFLVQIVIALIRSSHTEHN